MSVQNHDRQDSHVDQGQTAHEEFGTAASGTRVNIPNRAAIELQQPHVEESVSAAADDTRLPSIDSTGQTCRCASSDSILDLNFV